MNSKTSATILPIHETFQRTIQGEGALAGSPADFIRLYGCPVRCSWCDTGYSKGGTGIAFKRRSIGSLVDEIVSPLVVITGGEPFIHKDLPALCEALLNLHKKVSIETSGSLWLEVPKAVWMTLSPKTHVSPQHTVAEQFWTRANEVKLIIKDEQDLLFYQPNLEKVPPTTTIFLQPEWQSREESLPKVLSLLQQFPNYRLSTQLHKYINVP